MAFEMLECSHSLEPMPCWDSSQITFHLKNFFFYGNMRVARLHCRRLSLRYECLFRLLSWTYTDVAFYGSLLSGGMNRDDCIMKEGIRSWSSIVHSCNWVLASQDYVFIGNSNTNWCCPRNPMIPLVYFLALRSGPSVWHFLPLVVNGNLPFITRLPLANGGLDTSGRSQSII